ncbi:ribosome small subunit-dependent GTPase A [Candidatus Parabeggiatoa sp. HSG14]|uniref:ribosome small subunit-dependent GTPase A n=1 Tax=Candidatus Parabeggiatoa sp. HSG14 TaxID=3055593 RepID=UPI0025A7512B|nr:ribosome small subunit-dependent GTPase A [Thiotrichales bacterium HSG14]
MQLEELGFNHWFQERMDSTNVNDYQIARVISVTKKGYIIRNGKKDVIAELTGKLMFSAESKVDYPTVGDWVYAQYYDDDALAIIHEILPRKTILKRKTSDKRIKFQLLAANIDTAFIVQSLDSNYNLRRLERYLVMINTANIRPIVLLSKSDLLSKGDVEEKVADIHKLMSSVQIIAFSNKSNFGLHQIIELLVPKETYCLLGSSGVGKTSLLNNLLGEAQFDTQPIREKDGKGRHTTTHRHLNMLKNGAMLIDTPGIREIGNFGVESGINDTFDEIAELSKQCRYNDCSHTQEKGCAVLAALQDGTISQERYQNYEKMNKESAHYEKSYLEKRRKDKQLSKYYKSVMKGKTKRR